MGGDFTWKYSQLTGFPLARADDFAKKNRNSIAYLVFHEIWYLHIPERIVISRLYFRIFDIRINDSWKIIIPAKIYIRRYIE